MTGTGGQRKTAAGQIFGACTAATAVSLHRPSWDFRRLCMIDSPSHPPSTSSYVQTWLNQARKNHVHTWRYSLFPIPSLLSFFPFAPYYLVLTEAKKNHVHTHTHTTIALLSLGFPAHFLPLCSSLPSGPSNLYWNVYPHGRVYSSGEGGVVSSVCLNQRWRGGRIRGQNLGGWSLVRDVAIPPASVSTIAGTLSALQHLQRQRDSIRTTTKRRKIKTMLKLIKKTRKALKDQEKTAI